MNLEQANVNALLGRFSNFDDAVVANVSVDTRTAQVRCTIDIHGRDQESARDWVQVRFVVDDVKEMRFALGRTTYAVLSFGLQFFWKNDRIYILVDAVPEGASELPDLSKNDGYVAGRTCAWEVLGPVP